MIDCRPLIAAALLVAVAAPAVAADKLACDPAITAKTTLAELEKAYGKANVVTGETDGPEGTTIIATTIFPKDEAKKFEVYWWDEEKRERLAGYTVANDSQGPGGLKVGMGIAAVEKINGRPFTLSGFYWDYGGFANFQDGKLGDLQDGCYVGVAFTPSIDPPNDKISTAISGEQQLNSNMKEFEVIKPVVQSINVGFPDPEMKSDESEEGEGTAQ